MSTAESQWSAWKCLDGVYYDRQTLYEWNVDVEGCRVACAVCGGPIAVLAPEISSRVSNPPSQLTAERGLNFKTCGQAYRCKTFNSAGKHLCDILYESASELLEIGWTGDEVRIKLSCAPASYRSYTTFIEKPFSLKLFLHIHLHSLRRAAAACLYSSRWASTMSRYSRAVDARFVSAGGVSKRSPLFLAKEVFTGEI